MKPYLTIFPILILAAALCSCIEDGISTDPSDQPVYSTDTLNLGIIFTEEGSPTHSFKVYNRHDKIINLSAVTMRSGQYFRMNVDGFSGHEFANIEIRPNDSTFIFVEATLPSNGGEALPVEINDHIDITVNGRTSTVVIRADGQDVECLRAHEVTTDTRLDAPTPYQVFDSLVVRQGATLTLPAGTRLYFHDGAEMRVYGTLLSEGTPEQPVVMRGDRHGSVVGSIDFNIMPGQWDGIYFYSGSRDNRIAYTSVINTSYGVVADSLGTAADCGGTAPLTLTASRLHNSSGSVLTAVHSDVIADACELSDAPWGVVQLHGGTHRLNRCTLANTYIFAATRGAILSLGHINEATDDKSGLPYTSALITNSIIHGTGQTIAPLKIDGSAITLNRCLLKSAGSDDDNYLQCLWDTDPLFTVDRDSYNFDYRLLTDSPAAEAADPTLDTPSTPATDYYGIPLGAALGAFGLTPAAEKVLGSHSVSPQPPTE